MSDNLRLFTEAVYGLEHVVRTVPADAWSNPSPCEGWTASDVLVHAAAVLASVEAAARQGEVEQHEIEAEPHEAWVVQRRLLLESLDHPGVLHRVIASPFGEMPLDDYLGSILADTVIHTWDIARATGVDATIDPALVERAGAVLDRFADSVRGQVFADPVPVPDDADDQSKMLAFSGRRP